MRAVILVLLLCVSTLGFAQKSATQETASVKGSAEYQALERRVDQRASEVERQNLLWSSNLKQEIDEVKTNQQQLTKRLKTKRGQLEQLNQQLIDLNQQKQSLSQDYQLAVDDMKLVQGAYQKALSSLSQQWQQSPTQFAAPQRLENLTLAKASLGFPSLTQLNELVGYAVDDMQMTAKVLTAKAPISLGDGSVTEQELQVFGGLMAVTNNEQPSFIAFTEKLPIAISPVDSQISEQLKSWLDKQAQLLPLDLSQGRMLPSLAEKQSLTEWVENGGEVLWPILILAALGLVVALWRAVMLFYWRPLAQLSDKDGTQVDLQAIKLQLSNMTRVPAASVLANAITSSSTHSSTNSSTNSNNRDGGVEAMDQRLKQLMLKQMAQFERGLGFIALLAAMAPMLGLLGTVSGMIETFQSLTEFGNSDPKLLSEGISKALITTQAGLLVALPLLLLHYPLKRRAQALSLNMEQQSALLLALNLERGGEYVTR
ncbi:MotA/TolQ/ExbB proton channel [Shewanella halifaxensis HAW-EB4]|uniref:MotA/TolQ/ExbB proton channel n=1 Tax=Shewanella halifaxensis (strain HAW-EB4) TaxID=458817 RepID=B0TU48_SHEHH|nr:MotA/TolQ/ExbB proton channel family protein [Shewanella halifaxensis]ABZ78159.1 MotA/TolQ/ExbB proton channel [Shewanella halifaxensis HAW-EB4]